MRSRNGLSSILELTMARHRFRLGAVLLPACSVACALLLYACSGGENGGGNGTDDPTSESVRSESPQTNTGAPVPHDHDGDGVADHGPDAHGSVPHDHDGDGVPDHGPEAHGSVPHDHDGDGVPDHGPEAHGAVPHDHDGDGVPDHGPGAHHEDPREAYAKNWKPRPTPPSGAELARLPKDGGSKWNRLVFEKSPYLLQHAANPVDWYPWGDEALERAQKEEKPIFVSIGYSTCHWCHVMEHESFEDSSIADYLNANFVCIKVDREERPDIDNVYMNAVQRMRGRGGWPLNVFLLPTGEPFFGGTYFPREDRAGQPGFRSLLARVVEVWTHQRTEIENNSQIVANEVKASLAAQSGTNVGDGLLLQAQEQLLQNFDALNGGFGTKPKFPRSHTLSFLLRRHARTQDEAVLRAVETTLDGMYRGGIYDHLGGGFHRYSVDERWRVPHFEKMLYDQAQLAKSYLEAYQVTRKDDYADAARGVFRYVLRDMTSDQGAFYSAEDADTQGQEGQFYVWTPAEIETVLGREDAQLFCGVYGVSEVGNFEHGTSVLHLPVALEGKAEVLNMKPEALEAKLAPMREKLLAHRSKRVRPGLDDKVLTAWNGLMISSLTYGSQVLGDDSYYEAARRAADFILQNLRQSDGALLRRYRDGEAAIAGFIDDYAFFGNALVDLYETGFEVRYLEAATELAEQMNHRFWDDADGGYFLQVEGDPGGDSAEAALFFRPKEIYDGAVPSGNSVAALFLTRLGDLTANSDYSERAWKLKEAFGGLLARNPSGHTQLLLALDYAVGPSIQIVLAGEPEDASTQEMLQAIRDRFLPNKVVALKSSGPEGDRLARVAPFLESLSSTATTTATAGATTAYVCRDHACTLPTTEVAQMLRHMDEVRTGPPQ